MICNNNYLRVCEIKDLIWVMRFQSPLVYNHLAFYLADSVHAFRPGQQYCIPVWAIFSLPGSRSTGQSKKPLSKIVDDYTF